MSNVLTYKGYSTRIEYSKEDNVLFGKIEGIADLVDFESADVEGVEAAFREAVDDYLEFCAEIYLRCLSTGQNPVLLTAEEMTRARKRFSTYGQGEK